MALGTQAAKRGQASETGEVSTDDVVKFTLQAIEKSYECADKEGIHGNLNISVGSKEDATKGCEGICGGDDSKDRYKKREVTKNGRVKTRSFFFIYYCDGFGVKKMELI